MVEKNNGNVVLVEEEDNGNVVVLMVENNGNVVLEENNRIVVVEEHNRNVVVVVEENYRILWPLKLYQCATCYHFLSLHSAPEELT